MNSMISGDVYHRIYAKGVEDGARTVLEAMREFIDHASIEVKDTIKKHESLTNKEK